ncbi:GIY-YIG nuclease family protein [Clostridium sp.]|uniref:GIY-YIG nuclease family protein n=1 Tax=Clostridium sp. TaxID=1506 RepID=UPI0026113125|nr:GIY-YIG nuclease family protein [Clostridium sp.]
MFYIYLFYNEKTLLYVGKSINIYSRFNSHKSSQKWFSEVTHIHIATCQNKIDMDIYELYYINKLNPLYNIASVNDSPPTFTITKLEFKAFTIKQFLNKFTPIPIKRDLFLTRKNNYESFLNDSIDITNKYISIFDITSNKLHWLIDENTMRFITITNSNLLKSSIKYVLENKIDLTKDFEMPLNDINLSNKSDHFIIVRFTHFNTNTYQSVIGTGWCTFTKYVNSTKEDVPTSCSFININLIHLIKNNFDLKHIMKWTY